jgi:hypothetical protein
LCSRSIVSLHFLELEGSLPQSQELSTFPILNQTNPVHIKLSYFYKMYLIFIHHLHLSLLIGLFPSAYPTSILYTFIISHIHLTCLAHETEHLSAIFAKIINGWGFIPSPISASYENLNVFMSIARRRKMVLPCDSVAFCRYLLFFTS